MNKKKLRWVGLVLFTFLACNKDKFKSQPQVHIDSFGPNEAFYGQTIRLSATVTDKEGDLQDTVYLVKKRFNGQSLLTSDTVVNNLSNFGFPNKQTIELQIILSYGLLVPGAMYQAQEDVDRNFSIGIIVKDRAGHKSDYVESKQIVLKKQ